MAPKNVIVWILCFGIVVLLMTTCVQAKERVEASTILEQIENGEENINYDNFRITGELDLSEIGLEQFQLNVLSDNFCLN